jgi:pyruvate,orthophosphate dikinase
MVEDGLIDKAEAVRRVPVNEFGKLFAPVLDGDFITANGIGPVTHGLNASPGGACGEVVFSAEKAEELAAQNRAVVLCRIETSPEDIGGMAVAKGVLTARGGMTSHAAVVARGMGCPCVAGAGDLQINYLEGEMVIGDRVIKPGDMIAIDGFTGAVYCADVPVRPSEIVQVLQGLMKPEDSRMYQDYAKFMGYVDEFRTLGVWTNADTPHDTRMGVLFGAEGIGLTRTEHMFFEGDRIKAMREMILAKTPAAREKALAKLLPIQREDFRGIFVELDGRPATIRLLDPPLHEFLPHGEAGQLEMANELGVTLQEVSAAVSSLHEFNPMLGFRGCRLAIIYPEILEMQVRAIMEAAIEVQDQGIEVHPEIMIPLVGHVKELEYCRTRAEAVIKGIFAAAGKRVDYRIGTMIEVPRAALTADEIAGVAEFFSFGTNDLTQMTCGFSRDDAGSFLGAYVRDTDKAFYEYDPFQVIDRDGVGKLVRMACDLARAVRPDIKLGICGEHGGDPRSVAFCHEIGLQYVSCSPYRVPIARLAAAQAAISSTGK